MNSKNTQHPTKKTRHNPKWNISLIMLFVLAISSLIGLMATNSVQEMLSSTWALRDFYQSYYISKGGLELWILTANRYDYGFEENLTGTENILRNNLYCKKDCTLWLKVTSRVRPIDKNILFGSTPEAIDPAICNSFTTNKITLSGWSSYIIPLFADRRTLQGGDSIINLLEDQEYSLKIQSNEQDTEIGVGITLWGDFKRYYEKQNSTQKQTLYTKGTISNNEHIADINKFLYNSLAVSPSKTDTDPIQSIGRQFWSSNNILGNENFNYLFITNLTKDPFSFCLDAAKNTHWYSTDTTIITSIASYGNTTIGLEANKKKPLPDYIINSYSEY
jgi:hypothetical protein